MLLAEQYLVNVLKQGASCANMDDLHYSQYHYSKNKTIQHQTPKMHLPLNVKREPKETHLNVF